MTGACKKSLQSFKLKLDWYKRH